MDDDKFEFALHFNNLFNPFFLSFLSLHAAK